jgi:hypothetical protein
MQWVGILEIMDTNQGGIDFLDTFYFCYEGSPFFLNIDRVFTFLTPTFFN